MLGSPSRTKMSFTTEGSPFGDITPLVWHLVPHQPLSHAHVSSVVPIHCWCCSLGFSATAAAQRHRSRKHGEPSALHTSKALWLTVGTPAQSLADWQMLVVMLAALALALSYLFCALLYGEPFWLEHEPWPEQAPAARERRRRFHTLFAKSEPACHG